MRLHYCCHCAWLNRKNNWCADRRGSMGGARRLVGTCRRLARLLRRLLAGLGCLGIAVHGLAG